MNEQPFLTYHFQGFKFEFIRDEVHITNERYLPAFEKYRIIFDDRRSNLPFLIQLLEKGSR